MPFGLGHPSSSRYVHSKVRPPNTQKKYRSHAQRQASSGYNCTSLPRIQHTPPVTVAQTPPCPGEHIMPASPSAPQTAPIDFASCSPSAPISSPRAINCDRIRAKDMIPSEKASRKANTSRMATHHSSTSSLASGPTVRATVCGCCCFVVVFLWLLLWLGVG